MNRINEGLQKKGIKQTWLVDKLGENYNMEKVYTQNKKIPRLETIWVVVKIWGINVKEFLITNKEE